MHGPRFLKLRSSFERCIEEIIQEAEIEDLAAKEDLLSIFTEISLKYSLPSKLNELDERINSPAPPYDVKDNSSIEKVFLSYIQQPTEELIHQISQQEKDIENRCKEIEKEEEKTDKQIEDLSLSLSQWVSSALLSISEMRRHTK